MTLEEKAAKRLLNHAKTLALAESCSGGLVAHRLTNIPGSSDFLKTGIVAYSNEAKVKFLKVPRKLIDRYGAVSAQTAEAMAKGVRKGCKTDFGIGITGIAGPTGGSLKKPVGLIFIAVATKDETLCYECLFKGTRLSIKKQAADMALSMLLEFLI